MNVIQDLERTKALSEKGREGEREVSEEDRKKEKSQIKRERGREGGCERIKKESGEVMKCVRQRGREKRLFNED